MVGAFLKFDNCSVPKGKISSLCKAGKMFKLSVHCWKALPCYDSKQSPHFCAEQLAQGEISTSPGVAHEQKLAGLSPAKALT